ncbi:lipopolysaccharide biosynthesis protein [Cellvibrio zantedeschiae]|uniref:Lipopolysaccharide biosynthesis protein n=2 Tax=Cellvibrio zantedeschiae TaxID=1237077 RepID=A0ABQ3B4M0_9GAMM|nr:lipopolysaccharide biosynthesis protein [Cellvibrio zantedeschiae]
MSLAASGNSIISFIIFIVLSRILSATDIGLVAFALIVVEIGKLIVNAGITQAVIQRAEWDNTYASTCFYLNVFFSVIVTFVTMFVAAPILAHYYEPAAAPILKVLAIIFFLEGLKAVHEGKLKREFSFRVIALRTIVGSLASGVLGIYLAFNGFGVWALVWQQIVCQLLISYITISSAKWMPNFSYSWNYSKQILSFSTPLTGAQIIGNIGSKIFEMLVGIMMGPAALGFFRVGGRALYILQDVVLKPLETTILSALSRIEQPQQQALGVMRIIRMSCYITFPIFFGAAAIGPEFITFAFGEKWEMSGYIMTALAIGIAPLVVSQQINAVLTASGNSHLVMVLASITFVANCVFGSIAIPFGLIATALAFSLRSYLTLFFNLQFFKRVYGFGILHVLKIAAPSFISSLLMFAGLFAIKLFVTNSLPPVLALIILCASGAVIYALCVRIIFKQETKIFLLETIDLVPLKLKPVLGNIQRLIKLT